MNKKNGFTLVELLAVIVILAVILVIAVPQIMNVINESKKGVLESSARLIASSAETMKISNDTLGITSEIKCEDVANVSSEDYKTCKIDFINGKAHVSIVGKGKFEGMGVLLGTKDNVIATYGLEEDDTDDHNIRYVGSNPTNYVEFGNDGELWRIIGIFNMTTAEGKTEKLMKIVRNESIGSYSWDSSTGNRNGAHDTGEVNDGLGVNQWGASTYTDGSAYEGADLMVRLNDSYLNRTGDFGDAKTVKGIDSTSRNMIENVVWNTGALGGGHSAKTAYKAERGTRNGKECTSGTRCTDTVKRTTAWEGRVALIYPSDYGYASTNTACRNNIGDSTNHSCMNDNWLNTGESYWLLSSFSYYECSSFAYYLNGAGYARHDGYTYINLEVRPSIYLKSNVYIASGEGTESRPYKLTMN